MSKTRLFNATDSDNICMVQFGHEVDFAIKVVHLISYHLLKCFKHLDHTNQTDKTITRTVRVTTTRGTSHKDNEEKYFWM